MNTNLHSIMFPKAVLLSTDFTTTFFTAYKR